MTEKKEYKYSVSCSTEMKSTRGIEGERFGSDSKGMTSTLTVKFDDPADGTKLLGNAELINVIERVRHISITDVTRNLKLDFDSTDFETHEDSSEESEQKQLKDVDMGPKMYDEECSNCGGVAQVPESVHKIPKNKRYKASLCTKCYKELNPR